MIKQDAAKSYTQTVMMTGCGSVLWMAPEILLGETYNEKIDVFSYAMCLVELVDCRLPWSGTATGAEVPHKVTRGTRPLRQLAGTEARPVDTGLGQLIRDCWAQVSSTFLSYDSQNICHVFKLLSRKQPQSKWRRFVKTASGLFDYYVIQSKRFTQRQHSCCC